MPVCPAMPVWAVRGCRYALCGPGHACTWAPCVGLAMPVYGPAVTAGVWAWPMMPVRWPRLCVGPQDCVCLDMPVRRPGHAHLAAMPLRGPPPAPTPRPRDRTRTSTGVTTAPLLRHLGCRGAST